MPENAHQNANESLHGLKAQAESLERELGGRPRVLVGMSGGVDSSVAAALLVKAGFDVCGAYMKNWILDVPGMRCPWADDLADAKRTAVRLGIDFRVYDFQEAYKREVVDYLVDEYRAGRTPNPDVMCNQEVKFGIFLDAALQDGFDFIATGHYARSGFAVLANGEPADAAAGSGGTLAPCADRCTYRSTLGSAAGLSHSPEPASLTSLGEPASQSLSAGEPADAALGSRRKVLLRAADEHKDQTYFLYRMSQRAVDRTLFPLGDLTKPQVRALAADFNLPSAAKADSQGICFVGEAGIHEFLSMYVERKPGPTIDADTGETVGHHDGAIFFTMGQRKGLGIGGGTDPYFVVGKDMERNAVFVSKNPEARQLQADRLELTRLNWVSSEAPKPGDYLVRTRHTGPLLPAHVECAGDVALIQFSDANRAVASGQSVVVYDGDVCLGGGMTL